MYTYTFLREHFDVIIGHMIGLQIVVSSLALNGLTYTMVCETQIDADQYEHLSQLFSLVEVV